MYDDDSWRGESWRGESFLRRIPAARWIQMLGLGIVTYSLWKLGKIIDRMNRRVLTLEAILLDRPPRGPLGG